MESANSHAMKTYVTTLLCSSVFIGGLKNFWKSGSIIIGIVTALLAAIVLGLPWHTHIDVGNLYDHPYLVTMHAAEFSQEHQRTFRWTRPSSSITLPGAGRLARLTMQVHGAHPQQPIEIFTGDGSDTIQVVLRPGWQRLNLLATAEPWSGDVHVSITTPAQTSLEDERERGIALDWIGVTGTAGMPSLLQVILTGVNAALATLLVARVSRRRWVGILAGMSLGLTCIVVLGCWHGMWRLMLTNFTARLTLALLLGGLLLIGIERLLGLIVTRWAIPWSVPQRHWLAGAALLGFLLRQCGMSYPLNFISDIRFTMARATMVREGDVLKLFLPNPSLTPLQWNTDATIPRSPLYYILASPLTALPGTSARLSVMALSSAIDALAIVCVALLIRQVGGSSRAASFGALLAATLPMGLMAAMSWGLFPTLLAQCCVLVTMVVWVRLYPSLHHRRAMLIFATLLTLAYVSYPTAVLFLGTTWALLVVLLVIQRDAAARPTLSAGIIAASVALIMFYGWHIPAMFEKTLPTLLGRVASEESTTQTLPGLADLLSAIWTPLRVKYGTLVLGLALGGGLLVLVQHLGDDVISHKSVRPRHQAKTLLLAWFLTYPPMALASEYVVTFILKDVLYMLPALAVLSGIMLGQIARRRGGVVVAIAIVVFIAWQGVLFELDAIVHAFTQLK